MMGGFARWLPDFFKVKRIGAFTLGIGSALDERYLILFEGPSAADEDNLVVAAKQVRDLAGNPCLRTDIGASRVLDGQRTIAYEPFAKRSDGTRDAVEAAWRAFRDDSAAPASRPASP